MEKKMEIKLKNKFKKMQVKDLEIMRLSLCYNKETHDYEIYIKKTDDNAIVISNASNCREVMVSAAGQAQEILFIGKIDNMNIVDLNIEEN